MDALLKVPLNPIFDNNCVKFISSSINASNLLLGLLSNVIGALKFQELSAQENALVKSTISPTKYSFFVVAKSTTRSLEISKLWLIELMNPFESFK